MQHIELNSLETFAKQLSEKPAIIRLDAVHPCDMPGCTNLTYWQINGRMRCMACSPKSIVLPTNSEDVAEFVKAVWGYEQQLIEDEQG